MQPDVFYEHTMQENTTAAEALNRTTPDLAGDFQLIFRGRFAAARGEGKSEGRGMEIGSIGIGNSQLWAVSRAGKTFCPEIYV